MSSSPQRPAPPRPLLIGLAAGVCVALGWGLGQWQATADRSGGAQPALQRQADSLLQRLDRGEANQAEQRRLLELLVALNRKPEAVVILERLADQQPQHWGLRLLLAELRRDQNDRSGAERELRQLLTQHPDQIEALQLMALLQLETGRGSQAVSQLQKALERANKPQPRAEAISIGLLLANVLQRQREPGQAEALLVRLAADFPRDQRPLLARALAQQERGDLAGAQQSLAAARARRPDVPDPRLDAVAAAWGLAPFRALSPPPSPPRQALSGPENR